MTSVWSAEPWSSGLMFFSTPSGLMWTMRSIPDSWAMWSRKSYIAWNFQRVSTCSRGKGGGLG